MKGDPNGRAWKLLAAIATIIALAGSLFAGAFYLGDTRYQGRDEARDKEMSLVQTLNRLDTNLTIQGLQLQAQADAFRELKDKTLPGLRDELREMRRERRASR